MRKFRLVTASGTFREIDGIDCMAWEQLPGDSYDAKMRNLLGREYVYARRMRRNFRIGVDGMPSTTKETLQKADCDRQEFYIEPNIGERTVVYAPFERAYGGIYGAAGAFTRATIASYLDGTTIKASASGAARFEDAKLGKGILLEAARTNRIYPSHPQSGAVMWVTDSGAPAISWDATMASNVDGQAGTVKISGSSVTPDVAKLTIAGLTASTNYALSVWARGIGSVEFSIDAGATGVITTDQVELSMEWQKFTLEYFTTNGGVTSIELKCRFKAANTIIWLSAHQCEAGRTCSSYIPTSVAVVTRNQDQTTFATSGLSAGEGSIAFWFSYPNIIAGDTYKCLWYLNSDMYAGVMNTGAIQFVIQGNNLNIAYNAPGLFAGQMAHVAFVWKRDFAAVILNGATKPGSYTTSNLRSTGVYSTIGLYNPVQYYSPECIIDDLRVDNRYVEWRTAYNGEYGHYNGTDALHFARLTQARRFRMAGTLQPDEGDNTKFSGTLDLAETSSDEYQTIEAP